MARRLILQVDAFKRHTILRLYFSGKITATGKRAIENQFWLITTLQHLVIRRDTRSADRSCHWCPRHEDSRCSSSGSQKLSDYGCHMSHFENSALVRSGLTDGSVRLSELRRSKHPLSKRQRRRGSSATVLPLLRVAYSIRPVDAPQHAKTTDNQSVRRRKPPPLSLLKLGRLAGGPSISAPSRELSNTRGGRHKPHKLRSVQQACRRAPEFQLRRT